MIIEPGSRSSVKTGQPKQAVLNGDPPAAKTKTTGQPQQAMKIKTTGQPQQAMKIKNSTDQKTQPQQAMKIKTGDKKVN